MPTPEPTPVEDDERTEEYQESLELSDLMKARLADPDPGMPIEHIPEFREINDDEEA